MHLSCSSQVKQGKKGNNGNKQQHSIKTNWAKKWWMPGGVSSYKGDNLGWRQRRNTPWRSQTVKGNWPILFMIIHAYVLNFVCMISSHGDVSICLPSVKKNTMQTNRQIIYMWVLFTELFSPHSRWALHTWRRNMLENQQNREEDRAALVHYNRRLLHMVRPQHGKV